MKRLMVVLLLASISMGGCARIIGGQDTEMYRIEGLLKDRDYAEAIAAYRQISKDTADPERAAHAKFALASTLAYYDNPQKDYAEAFQEFDEFLKLYPDDERVPEARQWRSLLHMIVELEKENEGLNRNIEQYKQNIERLNKSIEQLKQLDIRHEERRRQ